MYLPKNEDWLRVDNQRFEVLDNHARFEQPHWFRRYTIIENCTVTVSPVIDGVITKREEPNQRVIWCGNSLDEINDDVLEYMARQ